MAKRCYICSHKNRCQIDQHIIEKTPYNTIVKLYKLQGKDPVNLIKNHVRYGHVDESLRLAYNAGLTEEGFTAYNCAKKVYDLAMKGAEKAEKQDLKALGSCLAPAAKMVDILLGVESGSGSNGKNKNGNQESSFHSVYMKKAQEHYAIKDEQKV